jgi:hypothetical protein
MAEERAMHPILREIIDYFPEHGDRSICTARRNPTEAE